MDADIAIPPVLWNLWYGGEVRLRSYIIEEILYNKIWGKGLSVKENWAVFCV
jgi:hypothetical protein